MLPILPAILLLLFQGPANIERLALEGRLPAALEAVQRMDQARTLAGSEAIATLLATSQDPQLAQALFAILNWVDEPEAREAEQTAETADATPVPPSGEPPTRDGFYSCRRTRDGPLFG